MTVPFCRSHGDDGGSTAGNRPCTDNISRRKTDVKPLRLYIRRVVIQSERQGEPERCSPRGRIAPAQISQRRTAPRGTTAGREQDRQKEAGPTPTQPGTAEEGATEAASDHTPKRGGGHQRPPEGPATTSAPAAEPGHDGRGTGGKRAPRAQRGEGHRRGRSRFCAAAALLDIGTLFRQNHVRQAI